MQLGERTCKPPVMSVIKPAAQGSGANDIRAQHMGIVALSTSATNQNREDVWSCGS